MVIHGLSEKMGLLLILIIWNSYQWKNHGWIMIHFAKLPEGVEIARRKRSPKPSEQPCEIPQGIRPKKPSGCWVSLFGCWVLLAVALEVLGGPMMYCKGNQYLTWPTPLQKVWNGCHGNRPTRIGTVRVKLRTPVMITFQIARRFDNSSSSTWTAKGCLSLKKIATYHDSHHHGIHDHL